MQECLAPDILAHLVEQVGQAAEAARHPGILRRMHLFSRARCTPANKLCGNWFVKDLQIYCHFTTQNSETALKTNYENKTILDLFSPFVRTVIKLVPSLTCHFTFLLALPLGNKEKSGDLLLVFEFMLGDLPFIGTKQAPSQDSNYFST